MSNTIPYLGWIVPPHTPEKPIFHMLTKEQPLCIQHLPRVFTALNSNLQTKRNYWLLPVRIQGGVASPSLYICVFMKKSPYKGTTSWKSPSFFKVRWRSAAKQRGVRDQFSLLTLCANQTEICSDNMWLIILAGASHFNKFLPFYHRSHCICLADKTLF